MHLPRYCFIRDDDTAVYGDKGYANGAKKRAAEAAGVLWAVKEKAKPGGRLTARQRARNHRFGKVRAKVEHVFRVVKCQFGYRKVRYRGIAKNGAQVSSIDGFVELGELTRELAPLYSTLGRPSVDPELMIRMLIVGYCFSIRSERRLCEAVHLNLAYRAGRGAHNMGVPRSGLRSPPKVQPCRPMLHDIGLKAE